MPCDCNARLNTSQPPFLPTTHTPVPAGWIHQQQLLQVHRWVATPHIIGGDEGAAVEHCGTRRAGRGSCWWETWV